MKDKKQYGSITLAREFDLLKQKVVLVMNRLPKTHDQLFGAAVSFYLSEIENEVDRWRNEIGDQNEQT